MPWKLELKFRGQTTSNWRGGSAFNHLFQCSSLYNVHSLAWSQIAQTKKKYHINFINIADKSPLNFILTEFGRCYMECNEKTKSINALHCYIFQFLSMSMIQYFSFRSLFTAQHKQFSPPENKSVHKMKTKMDKLCPTPKVLL